MYMVCVWGGGWRWRYRVMAHAPSPFEAQLHWVDRQGRTLCYEMAAADVVWRRRSSRTYASALYTNQTNKHQSTDEQRRCSSQGYNDNINLPSENTLCKTMRTNEEQMTCTFMVTGTAATATTAATAATAGGGMLCDEIEDIAFLVRQRSQ